MNPYRSTPRVEYRCGRGHGHVARAAGGFCILAPCDGIFDRGLLSPVLEDGSIGQAVSAALIVERWESS